MRHMSAVTRNSFIQCYASPILYEGFLWGISFTPLPCLQIKRQVRKWLQYDYLPVYKRSVIRQVIFIILTP